MADDNDDQVAADEWPTPQINRHAPFPPPFVVDLDVCDSFPLVVLLLFSGLHYNAFHATIPWWYWWAIVAVSVLWVINAGIRPQGRRLFAWIPIVYRYFSLWLRAPWLVGPGVYRVAKKHYAGGKTGRLTFLLPRDEGRKRLANVVLDDDGVIDTSASFHTNKVVRFAHWLFAVALGKEPLVRLLWISDTGSLDLLDAEARASIWAARRELLARPMHRMALYLRTRPFPVHDILVAAGRIGADREPELVAWACTLVKRRLFLAVPGATRRVLGRRMMALLGVGDQRGILGRAGLYGRMLSEDEIEAAAADVWGPEWNPMLAISPRRVEIETGGQDPEPIGDAFEQPERARPGLRRYVTYVIDDVLDRVFMGWTEPLTGRSIHGDLAIHAEPIHDAWARSILGLKALVWRGLPWGQEGYIEPAEHVARTLNLIRRRRSSALRVGMYATVSESQAPAAELALTEMVGAHNFHVPALEQLQARMATEPTARDPLNQCFWTDTDVAATAWPSTGGIWVEGCTLVGEAIRSNEPCGLNLWWEGDEAPISFQAGRSGSGKTNFQMGFIARHLEPHPEHWLAAHPPQCVVAYIKPWDEWAPFCTRFGGKHYRLTSENWRAALADAPMDATIVAFNMRGIRVEDRGEFLDALEMWVTRHQKGKRKKFPMIYVVGEAWAMKPGHLQQLALQDARALQIGLIVDTQYVEHLLNSDARDVISSCSSFALMKLRKAARYTLGEIFDIGPEGMEFLAQIAQPNTLSGGVATIKGRCIFEAHGLRTMMQFKRFGWEKALLDQTDPRLTGEYEDEDDDDEEDDDQEPTPTNGVVHHSITAD